jgi:hypothetical protein
MNVGFSFFELKEFGGVRETLIQVHSNFGSESADR